MPTRVIDVGDDDVPPRLIISEGQFFEYCALSSCWDPDTLKTTTATLKEHMEGIPLDRLPLTLREAVVATRALGMRYIWIESLCIVQDDEADRERDQKRLVYANATLTLSALDSKDSADGLFRPRNECLTSPVPIVFEQMKYSSKDRMIPHVLPVQAEKADRKIGPINYQASTFEEQMFSKRVVQFGKALLYWECLTSHGSESDPEGFTHPYQNSALSNSLPLRAAKNVLFGRRGKERSLSWALGGELFDRDPDEKSISAVQDQDSDDEDTSDEDVDDGEVDDEADDDPDDEGDNDDETNEAGSAAGEEASGDQNDDDVKDEEWDELSSSDDEGASDVQKKKREKSDLLKVWSFLLREYTSRQCTKSSDKLPAIRGLTTTFSERLGEEMVAGIWNGQHLLSSLLWSAKKPGVRNHDYPSWSWASTDAVVNLDYADWSVRRRSDPSHSAIEVHGMTSSQRMVSADLQVRGTLRMFSPDFTYWKYSNPMLNPYQCFNMSERRLNKLSKRQLLEIFMINEGYRDVKRAKDSQSNIYFLVVSRIGRVPPPRYGYPMFPNGTPPQMVCLVLEPVTDEAEDYEVETYRRIGLCRVWDHPIFWKHAKRDQEIHVI